jgi:hypothetical protein
LAGLTIKATVDGTRKFVKEKGNEFADTEVLKEVIGSGAITQEGLNYYVPAHEPLLLSTIMSNVAYGIAFLGAEAADAELAGNFDEAEHINARSGIYYARALFYAKRLLRLRDEDYDKAVAGGTEVFQHWVDETFFHKDDAEVLLIAGTAYLVSMVESEDGLAAAVDVPYARAMIEKSIELDPEYEGGMGLMLIGLMECLMPEMLGGNPKLGHKLMARAAEITDRGNHGVLVTWAERCAVATQDRKLFTSLLMEVIEAKDVPEYRITNKMARHNAVRLLKQVNDLFYD